MSRFLAAVVDLVEAFRAVEEQKAVDVDVDRRFDVAVVAVSAKKPWFYGAPQAPRTDRLALEEDGRESGMPNALPEQVATKLIPLLGGYR